MEDAANQQRRGGGDGGPTAPPPAQNLGSQLTQQEDIAAVLSKLVAQVSDLALAMANVQYEFAEVKAGAPVSKKQKEEAAQQAWGGATGSDGQSRATAASRRVNIAGVEVHAPA